MNELDFKRIGPPKQTYMSDQQTHAESMSIIAEKVEEIESLKQQLAAQEAVNVKLRDHIMLALEFCDLPAFSIAENLENALAIPSDTTALNELISKVTVLQAENAALKEQVAQLEIEFTAYKRATDLAYKGSELETQEQLTTLQSKSAALVDALNRVSMLLCEANPNCCQEYLFGVITGAHMVSEEALAIQPSPGIINKVKGRS